MGEFPYPKWREREDGPDKWIYSDKPLGHQCLWTCRWHTKEGDFGPNKILPVNALTRLQAWHELRDYLAIYLYVDKGNKYALALNTKNYQKALGVYLKVDSAEKLTLAMAKKELIDIREDYPSWVSNWSYPTGAATNFRPGWELNRGLEKSL